MSREEPFVAYLEGLRGERAALAALRRGLGQAPGTVADMYRYVVPRLPIELSPRGEAAFYLIAALFAYHPAEGGAGNIGDHFKCTLVPHGDNQAVERRFASLLATHPDDLDFSLRQAVSYLKSKEVPVNWHQLLADVRVWGHPDRYVQRQWARAFWGGPAGQAEISKEG